MIDEFFRDHAFLGFLKTTQHWCDKMIIPTELSITQTTVYGQNNCNFITKLMI